jgi:hypothetical protein
MQSRQVLISAIGLALMGTGVRADAPVKILGQDYTVTTTQRAGTFKNGVTVNLQGLTDNTVDPAMAPKKANLAFAPAGTADADRLFVVAAHADTLGITSDGLYMLQGADANGVFSPDVSNATVLLRGDKNVHGRPQNLLFLNDTDTGAGKDRNLVTYTFTNANELRFWDLGDLTTGAPHTEQGAFQKATVFELIQPGTTEPVTDPDPPREQQPDDPNMPAGNYEPAALAPNGLMLVAGTDSGDWAIGAIDPQKGTSFLPIKTLIANTAASGQIDTAEFPHSFVHLTGDEYLVIATGGDPNWNEANLTTNTLYHLRITLPADPTKEAADSIKVDVLDKEDLVALGLGKSDSKMIFGLAVGREVAAGKPTLYMADWAGNLFTLRPNVTPTAGP